MVVLHVACISNSLFGGVSVAVPNHILAQAEFIEVALLNVSGIKIDGVKNQIFLEGKFDINSCPAPFNKPDLVVFHECYRIEYISIAWNLKKKGVPYIIVPHGELRKEAQRKKRIKKMVANLLLFDSFIRNANALQCLSTEEVQQTSKGKNKFIGTNGILKPGLKKQYFNKDQVTFIYIGRYEWKVKGLDLLLDAVRRKIDFMRENNCVLYMYGPDVQGRYAYVENMILERGVGDVVKLNHEISGIEKENKLLAADIFIQTSRHEGMPCGILEALSYGIPCLITKGTSLGKIVEQCDAGWVAENAADSIAEKIEDAVMRKEQWQKKAENARKLALGTFAWEKVAKDTVKKYQEICEYKLGEEKC